MLEQQLGRRNLSEAEKYEIVQKFKSVFEQKAKKNQSLGGKGSANLPKVDTRKEMAKATGVSEGTYRKMDVVMKSDNEDLKQKLREKKVSVDAAYKEVKSTDQKPITVKQQIDRLDKRINDIDKTIESLQVEKEEIIQRRTSIFYALDIKCPVKYRWDKKDIQILSLVSGNVRYTLKMKSTKTYLVSIRFIIMNSLQIVTWKRYLKHTEMIFA